jgi:hypothetical protein
VSNCACLEFQNPGDQNQHLREEDPHRGLLKTQPGYLCLELMFSTALLITGAQLIFLLSTLKSHHFNQIHESHHTLPNRPHGHVYNRINGAFIPGELDSSNSGRLTEEPAWLAPGWLLCLQKSDSTQIWKKWCRQGETMRGDIT